MEDMAGNVIAFTDDGRGVASDDMMRNAMVRAKALDKLIVAHCEDENYPKDSAETEWKQLERDIRLIREIGCGYHVCHISTKESVAVSYTHLLKPRSTYLIFYTVDEEKKTVTVLRVMQDGMNWKHITKRWLKQIQ